MSVAYAHPHPLVHIHIHWCTSTSIGAHSNAHPHPYPHPHPPADAASRLVNLLPTNEKLLRVEPSQEQEGGGRKPVTVELLSATGPCLDGEDPWHLTCSPVHLPQIPETRIPYYLSHCPRGC